MKRKRTILMALMGLEIGGAETHVVELSKELRRRGYEVVVVSNGGAFVPELEAAGIRHCQAPLNRRSPGCMLVSLLRLRRIIRRERPDVVHAHARIPAFLCGLLQPVMGFAFVTTTHGVYRVNGLLRLLTNWGQRTIAVSEDIRSYVLENYSQEAKHVSLTINGIDMERFSPQVDRRAAAEEFGLNPDGPVLVHVSRLDASCTRVTWQLAQAAPVLCREIPGLQILVVGGGNQQRPLEEKAEEVNRALGRRGLILTGPRTDVNGLIAAGDAFVGVSRAALEAMSAQKPVLAAGDGGYLGLFDQTKLEQARRSNFCCRDCPPSQTEWLIRDLKALFALPPERRQALGEYGRQVISEYYSVRRMTEDCLAVYRQVWKPLRVLLSGYYGFNNLGDEAILYSIRRRLHQVDPSIEINVLSRRPEQTASCYGVRAHSRFNLWQVRRAIRRCDVLLSGGGSLLQDRTSTRSLLYYLGIIWYARRAGKPVMLYANGIGPVTKPANRRRVCRVLDQADLITLREENSAQELRDMGVRNPNICVTADPVFTLKGVDRAAAERLLQEAGIPAGRRLMGISVRSSSGMEQAAAAFAAFCDKAAEKYQCVPVFLLMHLPRDEAISRKVQEAMTVPSYLFQSPYAPEDMMGVIRAMEIVVSMRLHTLIFAASQRTPLMGFVYDPKVDAILDTLGMPSCGTPMDFDPQVAMERMDGMMEHREQCLEQLDLQVRRLEELALENERLLLSLL